jgi:hypothetical protein
MVNMNRLSTEKRAAMYADKADNRRELTAARLPGAHVTAPPSG